MNSSSAAKLTGNHSDMIKIISKDPALGHYFGSSFEGEVRDSLKLAGYQNIIMSRDNTQINVPVHSLKWINADDDQMIAEFDGYVVGSYTSFSNLVDLHSFSFVSRPPPIDRNHLLIVEAKLTAGRLVEWLSSPHNKAGSSSIFLDKASCDIYSKAVIINGGEGSKALVSYVIQGKIKYFKVSYWKYFSYTDRLIFLF